MAISRRQFLVGAGASAGATLLSPIVGRVGPAFGQTAPNPATAGRNRLVVVFLEGGNDGLNYVIPRADADGTQRYSVYSKVRPSLAYAPADSLALDRASDAAHALGFNKKLSTLHRFYKDGRVAIVQGVDYPKHSYSHFASTDIWHSGEPEYAMGTGWLGRHVDRVGMGEGELRAVGVGSRVPLMIVGDKHGAAGIASVPGMHFADGTGAMSASRHAALLNFGAARGAEPVRDVVGKAASQTVRIVEELRRVPDPPAGGSTVADSMITARVLLEQNLGVECVFVRQAGYDTHANQLMQHETNLAQLDAAIETFFLGTSAGVPVGTLGPLSPALASRTLVLVVSEFGRRIGEAKGSGAAGTDHGAAAPLVLIGPPGAGARGAALIPGIHGDHPDLGTTRLPADNVTMTTDLRRVYQSVLESWLGDSEPLYRKVGIVPGLFTGTASSGAGPGVRTSSSLSSATTAGGSSSTSLLGSAAERRLRGQAALGRSAAKRHRGLRPLSAGALVLDAAVAAVLIRSGHLRQLVRKPQAD
jgi:uncharacterized protein (DUF1501 family)